MTVYFYTNPELLSIELNLISSSLENQTSTSWFLNSTESPQADGDLVVLISNGVVLAPTFIEELVEFASKNEAKIIYFDRLSISHGQKVHVKPPEWSPFRLLNSNFIGPVVAIKSKDSGSKNTYLEHTNCVFEETVTNYFEPINFGLLSSPLYFDVESKRSTEILNSKSIRQRIINKNNFGIHEALFNRTKTLSVDIVIPTRLGIETDSGIPIIYSCLKSISLQNIENLDLKIEVVLDENSEPAEKSKFIKHCEEYKNVKIKLFTEEFNFSRKCNMGAEGSKADVIVFLNDDAEFIAPDSLSKLVHTTQINSVGAVGALLYYPDQTIQHAGHAYRGGNVAHAYLRMLQIEDSMGDTNYFHEVSSVTGACLAIRRELLEEIGNWNEDFPNSFNDIDLCLRLRKKGLNIIQHNEVTLIHHESISRDPLPAKGDLAKLKNLWISELFNEKYLRGDVAFEGISGFYPKSDPPTFLYYVIRILQYLKTEGIVRTFARISDFITKKIYGYFRKF